MNIFQENVDVHSRRTVAKLPADGIKCIEKLQSHFANTTFAEKLDMTGFFRKSHLKEGNIQ